MKQIEVRLFIDIDGKINEPEILKNQLMNNIDDKICGVVKRVDLIDETEVE